MSTKISQLTQLTAPANADYVPVVQASSSTTKYILLSDLMKIATAIPNNTITAPMLATNAITLGFASITASSAANNTGVAVLVTGLTASVTIPAGGRKVRIRAFAPLLYNATINGQSSITIWDGTVGSGTQLAQAWGVNNGNAGTGGAGSCFVEAIVTPAAGAKTYNLGLHMTAGSNAQIFASATAPAFIIVETI